MTDKNYYSKLGVSLFYAVNSIKPITREDLPMIENVFNEYIKRQEAKENQEKQKNAK